MDPITGAAAIVATGNALLALLNLAHRKQSSGDLKKAIDELERQLEGIYVRDLKASNELIAAVRKNLKWTGEANEVLKNLDEAMPHLLQVAISINDDTAQIPHIIEKLDEIAASAQEASRTAPEVTETLQRIEAAVQPVPKEPILSIQKGGACSTSKLPTAQAQGTQYAVKVHAWIRVLEASAAIGHSIWP